MYAMDLVQTCRKRKKKAMILKLDFSKAFDTVSWEALFSIMHIRGFDGKWMSWIEELLTSAKTAILLNGIPGKWINIKRGLRQGIRYPHFCSLWWWMFFSKPSNNLLSMDCFATLF
jgi:hypothetical protein